MKRRTPWVLKAGELDPGFLFFKLHPGISLLGKAVHQGVRINFPRSQHRRGKFRVIGCIGKILRFEAKTGAEWIIRAAFSFCGAIEKVSRIKLQSGLVGEQLQFAS